MSTYSLIIGCNYTKSKYELQGCEEDALNIREFITRRGYSDDWENEIITLTDKKIEGVNHIVPTFENITTQIEKMVNWAIEQSDPVDLFFHYSGHGSQILDKNKDEKDLKDECLVSKDLKLITDDYLKEQFSKLPPTARMLCLIDACHSGSSLDLDFSCGNSYEEEEDYDQCPTIFMLSGCRDIGTSQSIKLNNWTGAMTRGFLNVMKHIQKHNIELDMEQFKDLVQLSVTCVPQNPQLSSTVNNFKSHYISCSADSFHIYNDEDTGDYDAPETEDTEDTFINKCLDSVESVISIIWNDFRNIFKPVKPKEQ